MIHFSATPDGPFLELMNQALTDVEERYLGFDDPRDQEDWLCAGLPRSARFFSAGEVRQHLKDIQHALNDHALYEVSKYHWLLLYECLDVFCQEFNEQPSGRLRDDYGLDQITFPKLINLFFWDVDFLNDNIVKMTQQQRHMMVFPETFGLAAGFKWHPEELAIKPCDEQLTQAFFARTPISLMAERKEATQARNGPAHGLTSHMEKRRAS